jgi:hypothetical protein
MSNETQDSFSSQQSSYLEAIFDPFDGSSKLLSTISSANFDGAIPDLIIQYPNAITDDLIPGSFFLDGDTYYLITRVDENIDPTTTDIISYNVWYTQGGIEKYKTILNGVKIFTDGTELQIRKDDWANKTIGSFGWTITTEGNSIFSNVAVRGTIEATDGYFDGFLVVGDPLDPESPGSMKIGTNVNSTNDGIYINEHNYWYDSGLFKIGNATKNVTWNNSDLTVTGDINATGGTFSGKVGIGSMFIGVNASGTLNNGIHINGTNYWYDSGNFSLGTGTSTISFNGSNILFGTGIEISGSISANSLLLNNGAFSMQIKSNHNVVPSSQKTVNQLSLSDTIPQLVLQTSTNHSFVEDDFIYVSGLSNSGGGLGALNKVFQVLSATSNTITIEASQSTESMSVNADNSDTTLTVVDSEGVYVGMSVSGTGIASGTTVTNVADTVITISNATTQALSDVSITFATIPGLYNSYYSSAAGWSDGTVELSYDGIFVNSNNYWYSNGLFGIGDGTKGLTWDGSALNVTGIINASEGGSIAGWSIGSDEIFKGTGSSKIALNAGTNPKIYIGSGFHATAGTGFYVDSTGKFSLSNLLTFSPSVDIPEAFTVGTFNSGTNTITVTSASGIVKGMTVLGNGIASNSTVTNISGTTITTSKNATENGVGIDLTFLIDDFSELQVNGRIKGVIESTNSIATPRIGTTATSIVISGDTGDQIATITTTGHAFITGEKILIEDLPSTDGLNNLNRQFSILSVTDSITLVIDLSSITGVTNSTNTGLNGSITLRELTMGLHPAQGTGSYAHTDGTGIRLDKFNWWFTNNQFRVGSVDSYIKWTTDPTPLLDVVGQIRATSGYIGGASSGWIINSGTIQSSGGTSKITLDALNAKIYVGTGTYNNLNTTFYVDGGSRFSLGDKLSFDNGNLSVTGSINATSGNFVGTVNIGTGSGPGILKVGQGTSSINIVGTNLDSTTFIRTGSSITSSSGNGFYFGADGKIRIASSTNSLTFDGTNLNIVGGGTFSGSLSAATGTFSGSLSAATGTFSGALSGGTISIGSGNEIFKADTNGIYLGNANFASAPIRATPDGDFTADSTGDGEGSKLTNHITYFDNTSFNYPIPYNQGTIQLRSSITTGGFTTQRYKSSITGVNFSGSLFGGGATIVDTGYINLDTFYSDTWRIGPNLWVPGDLRVTSDIISTSLTTSYIATGDEPDLSSNVSLYLNSTSSTIYSTFSRLTSGSYNGHHHRVNQGRSSTTGSNFLLFQSNTNATADTDFVVRGDGRIASDFGSITSPADYAEYFEWADGNPNAEDRVGISVVLVQNKIVEATEDSEDIIGIVSGRPGFIGDTAWSHWNEKYLIDDFGRRVIEDYEVYQWTEIDSEGKVKELAYAFDDFIMQEIEVPENHTVVIQQRDKVNPNYDPDIEYVPREDRKEWDAVGLVGKVRMIKGKPVNPRWRKLQDITDTVEEWFIR